ncbi:MAG: hypothetical protein HY002_10525 [Candidatus Rokubacteria bacterium]|nr:hypothetical protein [Candidatus Rokubacteria bacterium]
MGRGASALAAAAALVSALVGPVAAQGPAALDRYPMVLPPAYPAPPAGFIPLPGHVPPRGLPEPVSPTHDHRWVPGRAEVVIGLDPRGRATHVLEYVPGHFERPTD